jgi:hypothetical protein
VTTSGIFINFLRVTNFNGPLGVFRTVKDVNSRLGADAEAAHQY